MLYAVTPIESTLKFTCTRTRCSHETYYAIDIESSWKVYNDHKML